MASFIKIFNDQNKSKFDNPPKLYYKKKKQLFYIPEWVRKIADNIHFDNNKVGFIMQLIYFRITNKFFSIDRFNQHDIEIVKNKLKIKNSNITFEKYEKATNTRHRNIILENLGYKKFDKKAKNLLDDEACELAKKQIKPKVVFHSLIEFLRYKKIEIPSYNALANIITKAFRKEETILLSIIDNNITKEQKDLLDELLSNINENKLNERIIYKLTTLKKVNQKLKPKSIKKNIDDQRYLKELFYILEPLIFELGLSFDIIKYYAYLVQKYQTRRVKTNNKKYILLIAFIVNQYFYLNDTLTDTFTKSEKENSNGCLRKHKDIIYERKETIDNILMDIENILDNTEIGYETRVLKSKEIINKSKINKNKKNKNDNYYDILEKSSIKLQNKVSNIVKELEFDKESSNKDIIEAIEYYKIKDGKLNNDVPLDFLEIELQSVVFDNKGKLKISLYKVLLFKAISDSIKSGKLNVKHSYQYRSFESYLILKEYWIKNKKDILKKTGLEQFENFMIVIKKLMKILDRQYKVTNSNIDKGFNKYISFRKKDGKLILKTPKKEKEEFETVDLFPKNKFISLFEVLETINRTTDFTENFEHWAVKDNRDKPQNRAFYAGIIAKGCNLGIPKTSKISKHINPSELKTISNWYLTHENIDKANNTVLSFMDNLELPKIFKSDKNKTHTSSDGQKFKISVDSLNSNYSYKYFGQGKGSTVYSFIDNSHRLFYSTVISSSEREASYVIDGLLHNEVVKSDMHSTDTHGYNELVFGITHLLGISFAPRIKNLKDQKLYSFIKKSDMKNKGYKVSSDRKLNINLIKNNWDDILRFVATIKQKEITASQLFKRLNSYSKQHLLYRAMKEFGRLIKTIFILRYIDDPKLRQMIEKQLNMMENGNKFNKAVDHGNNQEIREPLKEDQLISNGCRRLIQNSIICWNYLYVSQLIYNTKTENEKKLIIENIKNKSIMVWQHVNMIGEYDFNKDRMEEFIKFDIDQLVEMKIG